MFRIKASYADQMGLSTTLEKAREFFGELANFADLMPGIEGIRKETNGIMRWMVRAEVPVIGRVEGRRISGQIDRIAITEKEIFIIDYKTNRPPPENPEKVSEQYLAQMAAYRALLEKIYPGRQVRIALLWTFNLRLMELDEALYQRGLTILRGA